MAKFLLIYLITGLSCGFIATTPRIKKNIKEIFGCFSVGSVFAVILMLGLWL